MAQTVASALEALKEVWPQWGEEYGNWLNNSDFTRRQFEKKTSGAIEGRYYKLADLIGRNSAFAFIGEGVDFPTAGHVTFANRFINTHKSVGVINLTSEALLRSSTDAASVADLMEANKRGLKDTVRRELNYLLHHQGDGIIAATALNTTSNTITLSNATSRRDRLYMRDMVAAKGSDSGLRIDIGTTADPDSVASGRLITDYDFSNTTPTITIEGAAVSTTTSHRITRHLQGGTGADQLVPTSIPQLISNTELFGLDPADVPQWSSPVEDFTGVPVNDTLFEEAFDNISDVTGDVVGEEEAFILTTKRVRREYIASMKDRIRYAPLTFKGGFTKTAPTVQAGSGAVGLMVDQDCADQTAYLIHSNDFVTALPEDWHWIEEAGSPLFFQRNGSWEMYLQSFREYVVKDRRNNMKMTGVGSAENLLVS